jgi:hypothetical protein
MTILDMPSTYYVVHSVSKSGLHCTACHVLLSIAHSTIKCLPRVWQHWISVAARTTTKGKNTELIAEIIDDHNVKPYKIHLSLHSFHNYKALIPHWA